MAAPGIAPATSVPLTLELKLLQGRNLSPKDITGKSDPYVVWTLDGKKKAKSKVIKQNLNPEWNETYYWEGCNERSMIRGEVWDEDLVGKDFMGAFQIEPADMMIAVMEPVEKWIPLHKRKEKDVVSGEILIRVAFREKPDPSFDMDAAKQLASNIEAKRSSLVLDPHIHVQQEQPHNPPSAINPELVNNAPPPVAQVAPPVSTGGPPPPPPPPPAHGASHHTPAVPVPVVAKLQRAPSEFEQPPNTPPPARPGLPVPHAPPTLPPTAPPTLPPTAAPTLPPTAPPTLPPTAAPTLPPTAPPTLPPTAPPTLPASRSPPALPPSYAPSTTFQLTSPPELQPTATSTSNSTSSAHRPLPSIPSPTVAEPEPNQQQVIAPPSHPRFKAIYDYTAANDTEISVSVDQIIEVLKEEFGWYQATNLTTGQSGWVPGNYFEPN